MIVNTAIFGGATYESFTADGGGGIDFNDAEAFAVSQGGHLVSVHSAAENAFIYDTFAAPENAFIWTGLNDLGNVPNFTYTDGSPVDFTAYATGEPNGDGGAAGGAVHLDRGVSLRLGQQKRREEREGGREEQKNCSPRKRGGHREETENANPRRFGKTSVEH